MCLNLIIDFPLNFYQYISVKLRHTMKNDKTLNIYYGIDFENLMQETNEMGRKLYNYIIVSLTL